MYGIGKKDPAKDNGNSGNDSGYRRIYFWDEENRLKRSEDATNTVEYLYDADGQRTVKYSGKHDEALYFDSMWQENTDNPSFRLMKHIYLGETRIASRMKIEGDYSHGYESINTYYYHSDHLGSANIVTDYQGDVYEHIEYTPYGELFEEIKSDNFDRIPFRFTGKELDRETNLYYHGARYMDPRTSRWISSDPAGMDLMNPMGDDGKPRSGFSIMESQGWFGYVSNNPIRYIDPTGLEAHDNITLTVYQNYESPQSRDSNNAVGMDYAILSNADTGESIRIDGIQTYSNHESYNESDSIKQGSSIDFKVRDSDSTGGNSLAIGNAESIDGRVSDADGRLSVGAIPNTMHGNGIEGDPVGYSNQKSGGCFVVPVLGAQRMKQKLSGWGLKVGDTFKGSLQLDLKTIPGP